MQEGVMKLNYKKTILVGLAFFSISAFWQMYDHIIPLILKFNFDVNDVVAGGVMAMDNVLALFLLPLFGALSDRTKTKWGRRMPFIIFGTAGAVISMLMIPLAKELGSLPFFIVALGLTLLCMATYRSPAVALMPDVTIKPMRSKGNAIINLMGVLGSMLLLGLIGVMLPGAPESGEYNPNYFPVFLACMAIMLVAVGILVWRVKEPKLTAEMAEESVKFGIEETTEAASKTKVKMNSATLKSFLFLMASIAFWFMGYNAVTTAFSKYSVEVFGMGAGASAQILLVAQGVAIISFIPSGLLATKIGRKKTIMGGIVLLVLAFGIGATFTEFTPVLYVLFALAGIAWAGINVNSLPMVVDMAPIGEVGRYTGYYYTASMAAQILTPILSGAALEYIGYYTLLPYGALFVALSFVTMLFVKHGDSRPEPPKDKLEAFEALD